MIKFADSNRFIDGSARVAKISLDLTGEQWAVVAALPLYLSARQDLGLLSRLRPGD